MRPRADLTDAIKSMREKRSTTLTTTTNEILRRFTAALLDYDGISDTIRVSTEDLQKKVGGDMYESVLRDYIGQDPQLATVSWKAHELHIVIDVLHS